MSELYNIKSSDTLVSSEILPAEMLAKFKDYCHFYFGEYQDDFLFFRPESYDNEMLAAVAFPLFPSVSEMSDFAKNMLEGTTFNFPKLLLGMWCYGAFWSVPAMLLTSVLRNKYLIMCIPFFIKYGLTQTYQKISQNVFASGIPDEKTLKFVNAINPDGIIWINEFTRVYVIILFGSLAAVLFAIYMIISMKRSDCGA